MTIGQEDDEEEESSTTPAFGFCKDKLRELRITPGNDGLKNDAFDKDDDDASDDASVFYDEMDLVDLEFDEERDRFTTECPCGDKFFITVDDLFDNEERAGCPSCSLVLKVKYDAAEVRRRFGEEEEVEKDDDGRPT